MLDLSEVHIEESSLYERVLALYTRDDDMNMLYIEGKHSKELSRYWGEVLTLLDMDMLSSVSPMGVSEKYFDLSFLEKFQKCPTLIQLIKSVKTFPASGLKISEVKIGTEYQHRGLITFAVGRLENDFDKWFESLVLCEARLEFTQYIPVANDHGRAEMITQIFDDELRNVTDDDMWNKVGRQYFWDRVYFFTSRHLQIQACLPAFPCKSSNTLKVAGGAPDKGEELALRRLISVARQIKSVYTPGIKFWIVSDGHVFSDCIGVDDLVVNNYGSQLRNLYDQISKEDYINFCSLPQLFTSRLRAFEERFTEDVVLPHYLDTAIDHESETCRKVLMSGCSTDPSVLRALIDNSDPAKLALYRGFAKFMLEDLSIHPVALRNSKKQCKKLSAKVAFEMIKRNEAYSNLVSLLMPYFVRLSIHAHNNSGPKFGIKLLSRGTCRTVQSLNIDHLQSCEDLLHIPTPWHNCVVSIENDPCYYIVKSKVAKDAIASQEFVGEWKKGGYGEGGYYLLRQNNDTVVKDLKSLTMATQEESSVEPPINIGGTFPTKFGFFVPPNFRAGDICEMIDAVAILKSKYSAIEIFMIGVDMNPISELKICPTHTFETCPELEVLVVPGVRDANDLEPKIFHFLADICHSVEEVFGMNGGAMMLAKAGVLDGKRATAKSCIAGSDVRSFENVDWDLNSTVGWVCDSGIWTSCNQTASMDALYSFIDLNYDSDAVEYVMRSLN